MTSSATLQLHIGNAVPPGDDKDTRAVIELWHQINDFFTNLAFVAQNGINGHIKPYRIDLDAAALIERLESAARTSGSFTQRLMTHIEDASAGIDATLAVTVASEEGTLSEEESYQVATVFIQQLVMAVNLVRPGAIQILDAHFRGENAHRYEAPSFDSRILYGAFRASSRNGWPTLQHHSLPTVWSWLDGCDSSKTDVAIKRINKVLFTLLKVAETRHEYSARTALLVMYQLEVLLDCRQLNSLADIRHRTGLALGDLPDSIDWLSELHGIRNDLFVASQPVHRPPLVCHTVEDALQEQFGQYPSAVELGTALVLALVHDLVAHGAYNYAFTETLSRT